MLVTGATQGLPLPWTLRASFIFWTAAFRMWPTDCRSLGCIAASCSSETESNRTTLRMCASWPWSTGLEPVFAWRMTCTSMRMHSRVSSSECIIVMQASLPRGGGASRGSTASRGRRPDQRGSSSGSERGGIEVCVSVCVCEGERACVCVWAGGRRWLLTRARGLEEAASRAANRTV